MLDISYSVVIKRIYILSKIKINKTKENTNVKRKMSLQVMLVIIMLQKRGDS